MINSMVKHGFQRFIFGIPHDFHYLCTKFAFMTNVALQGLWNYIQTLLLTSNNRAWLAERLIESNKQAETARKKIAAIPKEYRCDPYRYSPSRDSYFADKRNVEEVMRASNEARESEDQGTILKSKEEIQSYLGLK